MRQLLTGQNLEDKAKKLGVSLEGDLIFASASGRRAADEATLQHRVLEAESHIRQNRLWWIAVISAVIAAVSAIASVVSGLCAYYTLHHFTH